MLGCRTFLGIKSCVCWIHKWSLDRLRFPFQRWRRSRRPRLRRCCFYWFSTTVSVVSFVCCAFYSLETRVRRWWRVLDWETSLVKVKSLLKISGKDRWQCVQILFPYSTSALILSNLLSRDFTKVHSKQFFIPSRIIIIMYTSNSVENYRLYVTVIVRLLLYQNVWHVEILQMRRVWLYQKNCRRYFHSSTRTFHQSRKELTPDSA